MWQAAGVILSIVTGLVASGLALAGFMRSGRAEDAQLRTGSTEVGLEHLKFALQTQQQELSRMNEMIGHLRGQLDECLRQREHQELQLIANAREIAELKRAVNGQA